MIITPGISSANRGNEDINMIERYGVRFGIKFSDDWSFRQKKLFILKKFLDNSIYDNLIPFQVEYDGEGKGGKYIKLVRRRPSAIYNLPKIIVNESTSLLFG